MGTGWTHQWVNDTPPASINLSCPLAGHRDMVFGDGVALTLVASRSAVGPGTFYVDYTSNILYIGNNPNGHIVEAAVQPSGINVTAAYSQ